ncbi:MAG: hypothetical protein PHS54_04095, partial [Clostridia bacterium]|nr:hypothetical protein [Clostridia bacterium]
ENLDVSIELANNIRIMNNNIVEAEENHEKMLQSINYQNKLIYATLSEEQKKSLEPVVVAPTGPKTIRVNPIVRDNITPIVPKTIRVSNYEMN